MSKPHLSQTPPCAFAPDFRHEEGVGYGDPTRPVCSQWPMFLAERPRDSGASQAPDSEGNREHFGLAIGGERGDSNYPLVRVAALMAVRSHLLARVSFGPYANSELELCDELSLDGASG